MAYDAERAVELLDEYIRDAATERAVADALRAHADDHDLHALNLEARANAVRTRLVEDGVLTADA